MYANKSIKEPMREGQWWRCLKDSLPAIVTVEYWDGQLMWRSDLGALLPVLAPFVTWTGPIPAPEDKPAPVRAHCPDVVERENELAQKFCEAMDKSTPSEDKRGKWGRRLSDIFGGLDWKLMELHVQRLYIARASCFHAECVKPYKRFVAAACALRALYAQNIINPDDEAGWKTEFDAAYKALSALILSGEPPKPRGSDEELGLLALNFIDKELGDLVKIILTAKQICDLGAAIRAELQDEAPSSPVSNDVLEGIAIDHLVSHRKIDESLAETCAMMILDIRAKLEGKA